MNKSVLLTALILSIFATIIMSYIAMATPIGPWVELILVLLATIIFRIFFRYQATNTVRKAIVYTTAAGGIGGIVATVCGFTLPTLYFLDAEQFVDWLAHPYYISAVVAGLVLLSGMCAFMVVEIAEKKMLANATLPFPIGQMAAKMISAQNHLRKAVELCAGILFTLVFGLLQALTSWIPATLTLFPRVTVQWAGKILFSPALVLRLDILPLFIAVGYVAGELLLFPLAMGALTKIFFLAPLTATFFAHSSEAAIYNFIIAFGGGMIIQSTFASFVRFPRMIANFVRRSKDWVQLVKKNFAAIASHKQRCLLWSLAVVLFLCAGSSYARFFGFSGTAQLYILVFTLVCIYQIMLIGGRAGVAPLGRFATLVMLPGFLLFGFNAVQITLVSAFVGLAGGIAVDCMFGRKMAQQLEVDQKGVKQFQFLGLLVAAAIVGIVFVLLVKRFGLGLEELTAQRAQARALLVSAYSFNGYGIALGFLYACFLSMVRFNVLLVFTGILFPVQYSLMLIAGGLITLVAQDKEEWDPFWSGVFAASSVVVFLRALL